jgi:hypothetical protein
MGLSGEIYTEGFPEYEIYQVVLLLRISKIIEVSLSELLFPGGS